MCGCENINKFKNGSRVGEKTSSLEKQVNSTISFADKGSNVECFGKKEPFKFYVSKNINEYIITSDSYGSKVVFTGDKERVKKWLMKNMEVKSFDNGGGVEVEEEYNSEEDLFQHTETLPDEVRKVLDKYGEDWEATYENCENMLQELEPLGYTFDYYLDAEPINLRQLEEFKTGGKVDDEKVKELLSEAKRVKKMFDKQGQTWWTLSSMVESVSTHAPYSDFPKDVIEEAKSRANKMKMGGGVGENKKSYRVDYWSDKHRRNEGISDIEGWYSDKEEAIEVAKKLYSFQGYSAVEVMDESDDDESVFHISVDVPEGTTDINNIPSSKLDDDSEEDDNSGDDYFVLNCYKIANGSRYKYKNEELFDVSLKGAIKEAKELFSKEGCYEVDVDDYNDDTVFNISSDNEPDGEEFRTGGLIDTQEYFDSIDIIKKKSERKERYDGSNGTYTVHKGIGYGSDGSQWVISWLTGRATGGDEDITMEDLRVHGSEAEEYKNGGGVGSMNDKELVKLHNFLSKDPFFSKLGKEFTKEEVGTAWEIYKFQIDFDETQSVLSISRQIEEKVHKNLLKIGELVRFFKENYHRISHILKSKKYDNGGYIGKQNALMVMNDNKQIKHHTEELNKVVNTNTEVPAWVVSKVHRSASDLSDATHYLDGVNSEFLIGGGIDSDLSFDKNRFKQRQKAFVGYLGDTISIKIAETFLGRKINSWNDDIITIGDTKYKKVYLRPEYKQIS